MTPGARLQAQIEILDDIALGGAADAATSAYFRQRRYIGSKDRSAIAEATFATLRRRARLDWWINRTLERPETAPPPPARHRVIAERLLTGDPAERVAGWFDGGQYRPAPFSRAERTLAERLERQPLEHPEQPAWVRLELPPWLADDLATRFGDEAELRALNAAAPLDLRVNPLCATRDAAQAALAKAGIQAEPTPLSPLGLRVSGRPPLSASQPFQDGWVEIQDEGSQVLALLVDARPGQAVLDYCAGAGGKTLALAGAMANKGRLVACDVHGKRLERAVTRLRRAGVHNVERRALDADGLRWLRRQDGRFDRVLVDAPCSGTGTWRRNPDMKWRIGADDLAELGTVQAEILDRAARLVKPGGRLVYGTCSLLAAENEDRIEDFLGRTLGFRVRPPAGLWPGLLTGRCPVGDAPYLRLSPGRDGTDGFFAAVLERVP